jgi:hypothetical protein
VPESFFAVELRHGMGNRMFQLASAYGISLRYNSTLCIIDGLNPLYDLFNPNFPPQCASSPIFHQHEMGYALTSKFVLAKGGSLLQEYLQSEHYFKLYRNSILQMFTFNAQYESKVIETLSEYYRFHSYVVSIHVRRGDLLSLGYMNFPPDEYFIMAMEKFESRLPNVGFLVVSTDSEWCKSRSVFLRQNVYVIDKPYLKDIQFGLISYSDGIILSMGTFGWWAAYIASERRNASVIYFFNEFNLSHSVNSGKVDVNTYYPASWQKLKP